MADDTELNGESRTAGVVRHLEELIFDGDLRPGQFLPSEGELATAMGVSRLTVREGVRTLEARGLLEVRRGRRPAVAHPNAAPLSGFFAASLRRDPRNLLELVEVRLALEVHAATLAAQQATRTALSSLELAYDTMRQAIDAESFNQADVRFHAVLAAASGNQMISFLIEAMDEPMHESRLRSLRGHLARGALDGRHHGRARPHPGRRTRARRPRRRRGHARAPRPDPHGPARLPRPAHRRRPGPTPLRAAACSSLGDTVKITEVETIVVGTPWREPTFVELTTDDGLRRVGEARPAHPRTDAHFNLVGDGWERRDGADIGAVRS
ncbi:FadR/GntR family transcriptional regulator [Nonomuraea salmonea]|uniref:FadR/GntR family transcriptional regulator n=1 Tax=Nonomuraea salmonea TaxID=46181 RepID=UPI0031EC8C4B